MLDCHARHHSRCIAHAAAAIVAKHVLSACQLTHVPGQQVQPAMQQQVVTDKHSVSIPNQKVQLLWYTPKRE